MTRVTALKVVNPILAILVINQIGSGFLAGALPREAFEILHEGGGFLLGIVALLHVILNWNWIRANFFRKSPAPTL